MNFLNLVNTRYTTKKYNKELIVSEDKIEQLKEILRKSPSSIDSQPWKFLFISDKKTKNELAKESYFNEHKVQDASHIIVFNVIDDIQKFENQIKAILPESSLAYYESVIKPKPEGEIKAWLSCQVYIALGFFLSACAAMEIDSTPMEGINTDGYAKILHLDGYKPLFAVAIGYRDSDDSNQPSITPKSRLGMDQVVSSI